MDTDVAYTRKGKSFNKFNEEVIACKTGCGNKTTITGTRLCDYCWKNQAKHTPDKIKSIRTIRNLQVVFLPEDKAIYCGRKNRIRRDNFKENATDVTSSSCVAVASYVGSCGGSIKIVGYDGSEHILTIKQVKFVNSEVDCELKRVDLDGVGDNNGFFDMAGG